jgi:hypothetical protein
MYIAIKVGIAALAAGLGVGVPVSFWVLQRHGAPGPDVAAVEAPPSNEGAPVAPSAPFLRVTALTPEPVEIKLEEVEMAVSEPLPAPTGASVVARVEAPPAPAPIVVTEPPPQQSSPVACGARTCPLDQQCCNASCGICVATGGTCTNKNCAQVEIPYSAPCGLNTCNIGRVCCNASCGICARPGEACSQRACDGPTIPYSVPCGLNTCNVGQICCNASCGICAAPDAPCSQEPCG